MKCETIYGWLLATRGSVPLPPGVQRHLDRCRACRRRRLRLLRLEQGLRNASLPPSEPAALNRLLHRLEQAPGPVGPERRGSRSDGGFRVWRPAVWAAVAAAVLLIAGVLWLLPGRRPDGEGTVVSAPPPAEGLVARLLEVDLRLAQAVAPAEQLAALADMAVGLRDEALRLARAGEVAELPGLAALHGRVVGRGIVGRARALPPQDAKALEPVVRQLRETVGTVQQTAAEVAPEAAVPLQTMHAAATDALAVLQEGRPAAAMPAVEPVAEDADLHTLLVVQGLRLAEEEDPLKRAECCADVGDHLVRAVLDASLSSDVDLAAWYGRQLGSVLDRGVAGNLARVKVKEDAPAELAEFRRVYERGARATAVLEENLRQAPPAAQEGLERALEASRPPHVGPGGNKPEPGKKGKGPGKPPRSRDKPGPPGQQKKPAR